jgi:hypothetical protein
VARTLRDPVDILGLKADQNRMSSMHRPSRVWINLEKLEANFSAAQGSPVSLAEVRAYLEANKINHVGDGCWQIDPDALDLLHPSGIADR